MHGYTDWPDWDSNLCNTPFNHNLLEVLFHNPVYIPDEVLRANHLYIFQESQYKPARSLETLHLRNKVVSVSVGYVFDVGDAHWVL